MTAQASLQLLGLPEMQDALAQVAAAGAQRPMLTLIAAKMKKQTSNHFRDETDPVTGAKWPPKSELTRKLRGSTKLLYQTGALQRSLIACIPRITENSATIWTNLVYAQINNDGGIIRATGSGRARPSKNPHLAIPLTREASRAGSANRWWAKQVSAGNKPFTFRAKSGALLIATQVTRGKSNGGLLFHFLLVKQVKIPRRTYLAFGEKDINEMSELVLGTYQKVIDKVGLPSRTRGQIGPSTGGTL